MRKKKAYKIVYRDLMKVGLFRGHYDAKNGKEDGYMYGISSVMENIAFRVSEEKANEYMEIFATNFLSSKKKAGVKP